MNNSAKEFIIRKGVLTKYNGDAENVVIPEGVTEIYARAFMSSSLRTVTLPNSLKIIGRLAFACCDNLRKVVIPDSIELMRDGIFSGCASLEEAVLPSNLKTLPPAIFYHCPNLTKVNFPETLTKIEGGALHACYKLTELELPDGITEIGPNAFSSCFSLRKVKLPNSLTELGQCAFEMCGITDIDIPQGVTTIRFNTFEYCKKLKNVTLREGLQRIGSGAFNGCVELKEIRLPNSVEYVDLAFGNTALTNEQEKDALYVDGHLINVKTSAQGEFFVEEGTKSISCFAFHECKSITSVHIPNSVKIVGGNAFNKCKNLTIYADFDQEPTMWSKYWNGEKCSVVWQRKLR